MRREGAPDEESYWPEVVLVLHAEAATVEFASLRFGTYIAEWLHPLTNEIERLQAGFFSGESLNELERGLIERYCKGRELAFLTRREWADQVLFHYGYYLYGAVVGFNLPFHLSRVAARASVIGLSRPQRPRSDGTVLFQCRTCHQRRKFRLEREEDGTLSCFCTVCHQKAGFQLELLPDGRVDIIAGVRRTFAGGWKLVVNEYEKKATRGQWRESAWRPNVWIKPINPKAAMYRWGFFAGWAEKSAGFYEGHFLDLRTLGFALSPDDEKNSRKNDNLRAFGERFGAPRLQAEVQDNGDEVTEARLNSAMNDAEAALSLYYAEMAEYRKHGLNTTPDHIYSGASLGKAYLRKMGIYAPASLAASEASYSADEVFGFGMSAYYSGRSEGQIVKSPVPVTYVDFHGMYPAVCSRQHLWDLMKAKHVKASDAMQEVVEFLGRVQPNDLYMPETWTQLNVLCLVEPRADLLPVRADYRRRRPPGSKVSHRIALAEVASAPPMWYALADLLVSYLKTGKRPQIVQALRLDPAGTRELLPVAIRGGVTIDPNSADFFQALVEARDSLQVDDPKLAEALKIVANATSYGIWAEVDIEEGRRPVTAYSTEARRDIIPHGEKPGRYYFPPLAACITAGARLMLGLLEHEIQARRGVSAFCDTDSLAIVSSRDGSGIAFRDHRGKTIEIPVLTWGQVSEVLAKFEVLNPYRSGKPLIKLEKENFADQDSSKPRVDLHAYVIAAKRYALYVPAKLRGDPPTVVKASYHTLGIVQPPHDVQGREIDDWIDGTWLQIVTARPYAPPWADQPVEFRTVISRPEIRWSFRGLRSDIAIKTGNNWMDNYLATVKPFNTVAVLQKSQDKFSLNPLESDALKGVPVVASVGHDRSASASAWIAKNSGRRVFLLPPEEPVRRPGGTSEDEFARELEERRLERQAAIRNIAWRGGLFTTYMTFAELLADYQHHHENKSVDSYGDETDRDTRGRLRHPLVRITELLFTGKEFVLHEELETGIVSEEEAETYRFMIRPERDPTVELVMEVLRLLSSPELKRLKIGWRVAEKIKAGEGGLALKDGIDLAQFGSDVAKHLEKYPEEVGQAEGEEALRAFLENRKRLLQRWEDLRPRISELETQELVRIAGCSKREAIRIKKGEVVPKLNVMRRVVAELSSDGYNLICPRRLYQWLS